MNHIHLYPRVSHTDFTVKSAGGPQDKILPIPPSTVPEGPVEGRHLHSNGSTSLGSFSREMQYQSTEADRARTMWFSLTKTDANASGRRRGLLRPYGVVPGPGKLLDMYR